MNTHRRLLRISAFFRRDLAIARSYKFVFGLEILEAFFGVATFYYLSRFVTTQQLTNALPGGSNYFAFALVGFAFFDYLTVSFSAFENGILEARQNGTLEAMLVTQTQMVTILGATAVYPFLLLALRTIVYLAWGILLFHFPIHRANWTGAVLILLTSVLAFSGLGILSASYLLLFKRGNPARWLILGLSGLLGGIMYPVSILPMPLQWLSRIIPVSYSLQGMREAILTGAKLVQLWPSICALLVFSLILLPLSTVLLAWALRRTKIAGTLTHF